MFICYSAEQARRLIFPRFVIWATLMRARGRSCTVSLQFCNSASY